MKAQVDFSCFVDQEHPFSLRTALKGVESLVLFLLSWAVLATSGHLQSTSATNFGLRRCPGAGRNLSKEPRPGQNWSLWLWWS